jgi:hypothetical protein
MRRLQCGSRSFEKEFDGGGGKRYAVHINTPPKELMDGHVIATGPDGGWLYAALSEKAKEAALTPHMCVRGRNWGDSQGG